MQTAGSHLSHHDQSGTARVFAPSLLEQLLGYLLRVDDNERGVEIPDSHQVPCATTVSNGEE